jgi:hypothetical protein
MTAAGRDGREGEVNSLAPFKGEGWGPSGVVQRRRMGGEGPPSATELNSHQHRIKITHQLLKPVSKILQSRAADCAGTPNVSIPPVSARGEVILHRWWISHLGLAWRIHSIAPLTLLRLTARAPTLTRFRAKDYLMFSSSFAAPLPCNSRERVPLPPSPRISYSHIAARCCLPLSCSCRQSLELVGHEALGETGNETPDKCSRIVGCVGGPEIMNEFVKTSAHFIPGLTGEGREE